MLRLALIAALAASLLVPGARAQLNADQLNKLSLESLTATPPRAAPRPAYRPYAAPARPYHGTRSFLYRPRATRPYAFHPRRPFARPHGRTAWRFHPRPHHGSPYYRR